MAYNLHQWQLDNPGNMFTASPQYEAILADIEEMMQNAIERLINADKESYEKYQADYKSLARIKAYFEECRKL